MNDSNAVSPAVVGFTLAIDDMFDVVQAARLIADEDPDLRLARRIREVGLDAAVAEARSRPPSTALGDFRTRLMLETGLVVTYGRAFTRGDGNGFPLPVDEFVPEDKRQLHKMLLGLRHQVYAHMDASGPEPFRRRVVRYEATPDGAQTVETRGPALLKEDQLRQIADLAEQIVARLEVARRDAHGRVGS